MWNRELLLLLLCASVAAFAASAPRLGPKAALHAHWFAPAVVQPEQDGAGGPQLASALAKDDPWAGDALARAREAH